MGLFGSTIKKVALKTLNGQLEGIATFSDIELQPARKHLSITGMLEGESEPFVVTVDGYAIQMQEGDPRVVITKASSDRAWMQAVIQKFVLNRALPLPGAVAKFLG